MQRPSSFLLFMLFLWPPLVDGRNHFCSSSAHSYCNAQFPAKEEWLLASCSMRSQRQGTEWNKAHGFLFPCFRNLRHHIWFTLTGKRGVYAFNLSPPSRNKYSAFERDGLFLCTETEAKAAAFIWETRRPQKSRTTNCATVILELQKHFFL